MATAMLSHGDTLRVFMRQAPLNPEVWERGAAKSKATAAIFQHALLERREDIKHPDPELAVDMAWRMAYTMIARWVTHGSQFESGRPLDDEKMIRELARAVASYLL
jgi:hypothetical protein